MLTRRQRWQVAGLTAAAVALFAAVRLLPVGTHLNHMDFRAAGPNVIEFCDPANPAFIPVVAVKSPVEMRLTPFHAPRQGRSTLFVLRLSTANGKSIGPRDLLVNHTERLHLLVVDPTLRDYQHIHPRPGAAEGSWEFEIKPRSRGTYRVFADFVPAATGRGLYAHADFVVPGEPAGAPAEVAPVTERDGYRYAFSVSPAAVRVRKPARLTLELSSLEGGPVPLEPIMGAYAHVVAFDQARSGFAHLHPLGADPLAPPDPRQPRMEFQVEIPQPGDFVVWAQVKISGVERFVPFPLTVAP